MVKSTVATPAALAVVGLIFAPSLAQSAPTDLRGERQASIFHVLRDASARTINSARGSCASGQQPASIAERRRAGGYELPDAADYCVAVLTRLGRDGVLGYVRDTRSNSLTPSLAFDNGFVAAYRKNEPIKPNLPSMSALRPVAERCLAQGEPDTDVCFAAGYAFGARAASGEVVAVR